MNKEKYVSLMDVYKMYFDASDFGVQFVKKTEGTIFSSAWWSAWRSARKTAEAFIFKAKDLGLTDEQVEEFRKLAREVAPE